MNGKVSGRPSIPLKCCDCKLQDRWECPCPLNTRSNGVSLAQMANLCSLEFMVIVQPRDTMKPAAALYFVMQHFPNFSTRPNTVQYAVS